jgi:hypothetical protein
MLIHTGIVNLSISIQFLSKNHCNVVNCSSSPSAEHTRNITGQKITCHVYSGCHQRLTDNTF